MSVLHKLTSITEKSSKRLGRGYGSGKGGHTVGRGTKGMKARVGAKTPLWFEGGQLQLIKRLPMWRGKGRFKSLENVAEVTLSDIDKMTSDVITLDTLKLERVISKQFKKVKILSTGTISRKVTVQGVGVSQAARKAIESAHGTIA